MSKIETQTEAETTDTPIEIETIYEGQCESISGRSMLRYAIGRHPKDGGLHLRIVSNSGRGMFCKDPVSASQIDDIIIGEESLTGTAFQVLFQGRSINSGSFTMACCKDLGLIRANEENSRIFEHVPTTSFKQVALERIGQAGETVPKAGRKSVGASTKRKAKEV